MSTDPKAPLKPDTTPDSEQDPASIDYSNTTDWALIPHNVSRRQQEARERQARAAKLRGDVFAKHVPSNVYIPSNHVVTFDFDDEIKEVSLKEAFPDAYIDPSAQTGHIAFEASVEEKREWIQSMMADANRRLEADKKRSLEPVALFDGSIRAVAWLPDPETRKLSLKRLGDENAELQDAYAEGRTGLILWRTIATWIWIAQLTGKNILSPLFDLLVKLQSWGVAAILWLKFW